MIGRHAGRRQAAQRTNHMPQLIDRQPVSIAINTSLSSAVTIRGGLVAIIEMPAAWDTADLT